MEKPAKRWSEFVEKWFFDGVDRPWDVIKPKEGFERKDINNIGIVLNNRSYEHGVKIRLVASMMEEKFEFIEK